MAENAILAAARAATKAGIVALPTRPMKKAPAVTWTAYQSQAPSAEELKAWFVDHEADGLGVLCGAISGNLELLEFEDLASVVEFKDILEKLERGDLWRKIEAGYAEASPSGGVHWLYRIEVKPGGNAKLASKPCPPDCGKHEVGKPHVLIETRGEGGFVVVAPTTARDDQPPGSSYRLASGGFDAIVTLTAEEHELLFQVARSLDEMPVAVVAPPRTQEFISLDGERPGDRYNRDAPWDELLAGWKRMATRKGLTYWSRPGKKPAGISATTGKRERGDDMLRVFSSSTALDTRMYSPFAAYATLAHGGDFSAAARALAQDPRYRRPDEAQGGAEALPDVVSTPLGVADAETGEIVSPVDTGTGYRFDPVFPRGSFIGDWVAWCSEQNDAALEYHEAAGLVLLSCVTSGVKLYMRAWRPPKGLRTNLYVVLMGNSSTSRKTTSTNLVRDAINEVYLETVNPQLADQGSVEGFVEQIADRSPQGGANPSLWVVSEFGQMLEDIERKDTEKGRKRVLLELYDGARYEHNRVRKRQPASGEKRDDKIVVEDPYLSVLGGSTPDILEGVTERDIESGLLPRFAYVWPTSKPPERDIEEIGDEDSNEWRRLIAELRAIRGRMGSSVVAKFEPDAQRVCNDYMMEVGRRGKTILARLGAMSWKVAMLSAAQERQDSGGTLTVTSEDARRGVAICRRWEDSAVRFSLGIGGRSIQEKRFEAKVERIKELLRSRGGIAPRSDVMRALRLSRQDADELQATMGQRGELVSGTADAERKGAALLWKLV